MIQRNTLVVASTTAIRLSYPFFHTTYENEVKEFTYSFESDNHIHFLSFHFILYFEEGSESISLYILRNH